MSEFYFGFLLKYYSWFIGNATAFPIDDNGEWSKEDAGITNKSKENKFVHSFYNGNKNNEGSFLLSEAEEKAEVVVEFSKLESDDVQPKRTLRQTGVYKNFQFSNQFARNFSI